MRDLNRVAGGQKKKIFNLFSSASLDKDPKIAVIGADYQVDVTTTSVVNKAVARVISSPKCQDTMGNRQQALSGRIAMNTNNHCKSLNECPSIDQSQSSI